MRKSQLFQVRDNNKTVRDVVSERDFGAAKIKSYAGPHDTVAVTWDLNDAARESQIIKLQIGSEYAYVSTEELQRYLRWT